MKTCIYIYISTRLHNYGIILGYWWIHIVHMIDEKHRIRIRMVFHRDNTLILRDIPSGND